jgi:plasmid maintenance system antidote protein VapI
MFNSTEFMLSLGLSPDFYLEKLNNAITFLKSSRKIKTHADLARKMQLSKSYISEIISGQKPLTRDFIEKFEKRFNVSIADMLPVSNAWSVDLNILKDVLKDVTFTDIENAEPAALEKMLKPVDFMYRVMSADTRKRRQEEKRLVKLLKDAREALEKFKEKEKLEEMKKEFPLEVIEEWKKIRYEKRLEIYKRVSWFYTVNRDCDRMYAIVSNFRKKLLAQLKKAKGKLDSLS